MEELTYEEFINNILETRGRFNCGDEYHERHHIIPKCCGGGNEERNLIDLFAREHFIAHKLLAIENSDNRGLITAWAFMAFMKNDINHKYELSAEEYEEARITLSRNMSGENNPMWGRTWWDENTPQEKIDKWNRKRSDSLSGENHYLYGGHPSAETCKKIGERNKGKKRSAETRKKISEGNQGRVPTENMRNAVANANKNRIWSEDSKEKLKKSMSGDKNPMCGRPWWDENTSQDKINEWKQNTIESHSIYRIPVIQLTTQNEFVTEYQSVAEASIATGIPESNIIQVYNHTPHRKTAGGYKWITKEEYLTTQND